MELIDEYGKTWIVERGDPAYKLLRYGPTHLPREAIMTGRIGGLDPFLRMIEYPVPDHARKAAAIAVCLFWNGGKE